MNTENQTPQTQNQVPDIEPQGPPQDIPEERFPDDVEAALAAARQVMERRNADKPDAPPPSAYYLTVCGEHMVFMQPTLPNWQMIIRIAADPNRKHEASMTTVTNTLFWMRGQEMPNGQYSPTCATQRARHVMSFGGAKVFLADQAAGALLDALSKDAGEADLKKR